MWTVEDSAALAREYVAELGDRWAHLSAVGRLAERLAGASDFVPVDVVSAAWLHDIGYAPSLANSGFHPLDGAWYLQDVGAPATVFTLVAHNMGAGFEADERGLLAEWRELPYPDARGLDVLNVVDLATGPSGQPMLDLDRVADMLDRYDEDHPVHRAVTRSRDELLESSARAKALLGLPEDWPVSAGERVGDAQPHREVRR